MVFHSMIQTFGTCLEDMFVCLTKDHPHLVVAVAWCLGDMDDLVPHWTDHHPHALLQVVSWLHPANLSSLGKVSLHTLFCLHLYKLSKSTYMWLGKVHMSQTLPNISEPMATLCFSVRKSYWPPFFSENVTTGSWVTGSLIIYPGLVQPCTLARWFIWVVAAQISCMFTRICGEMLQFGFSNGLKPPHLVIYWLCCCTVESLNICGWVRTR